MVHRGPHRYRTSEKAVLDEFRSLFENEKIEKTGHDLKRLLSVFRWSEMPMRGKLFDTMLAHSLLEPDLRHSLNYIAEASLGYATVAAAGESSEELNLPTLRERADKTVEEADLAFQLRTVFEPLLHDKCQEKVFYERRSETDARAGRNGIRGNSARWQNPR